MKASDDTPVDGVPSKADAHLTDSNPEKLRRSERAFLRIPVQVEGQTDSGKAFSERTNTLVINRNGARISLKAAVRVDTRITMTNLQSSKACPFRVVARVLKTLGNEPEWGVECLEPDKNFWGISFPEKIVERTPSPALKESVDALIECTVCGSREFAHLTLAQYRELGTKLQLERPCPQCNRATAWKFGFVEDGEEEWGAAPAAKEPSGAERRQAKRLPVKLPVKIRTADGREEIGRTEDLSKTGACFNSSLNLQIGDRIHLTVGYSEGSTASEVAARVMRRREFEPGKSALYGVCLEES